MFIALFSIRDQLEANQGPINRILHKLVVHSPGGVLFGNKKECATDTYKNLVEAQKHYGEQNQPDITEHTVQFHSHDVTEGGGKAQPGYGKRIPVFASGGGGEG